jgi:uncharacterized protein YukE
MDDVTSRAAKAIGDRLVERWDGGAYERYSSHQRQWGGDLIAEIWRAGSA